MSKAYEMISESLNEIIQDLEETGGKNLNREIISHKQADEKISEKKTTIYVSYHYSTSSMHCQ